MIARTSVLGISITRQTARRRLLVLFWLAMAGIAMIVGLRADDLLPRLNNSAPSTFGTADGIGAALVVYVLYRLIAGRIVDVDGSGNSASSRFAFINGFLGGLLWTERIGPHAKLIDERDSAVSYRAYFQAYRWLRIVALIACLLSWSSALHDFNWLVVPSAFLFFLAAMFLPQSIILWTEPDVEEPR